MLRAAVFDLDYTLFDPRTLPRGLFTQLEHRVRSAAAGLVSAAVLDAAIADAWRLPFDRVVERHRLPEPVITAWHQAASAVEVTEPLTPYPDVRRGLERLPLRRFLLTTGFHRLQESKVRLLGLTTLFEAVYIDALDPLRTAGKRVFLERLLTEQRLVPAEVVVFGDQPDDELSAALALGMTAVQVLRPGVVPSPHVSWRIPDFDSLPGLLARLEVG